MINVTGILIPDIDSLLHCCGMAFIFCGHFYGSLVVLNRKLNSHVDAMSDLDFFL